MILGERVRLRAIERADIPTFVRWFNDPEVRQYLSMYLPMSTLSEERWFEQAERDGPHDYGFAVEAPIEGGWVHIGNVGLHKVDWKNRVAEFGIALGEKAYWSQGYGTDAARTILRFAFQEMNLHRVYLHVFDYNPRAQRCYEKAGFQREGILREALFHEGQYHDIVVMGALAQEWGGA
jgi:diamine N-acetyltransferase